MRNLINIHRTLPIKWSIDYQAYKENRTVVVRLHTIIFSVSFSRFFLRTVSSLSIGCLGGTSAHSSEVDAILRQSTWLVAFVGLICWYSCSCNYDLHCKESIIPDRTKLNHKKSKKPSSQINAVFGDNLSRLEESMTLLQGRNSFFTRKWFTKRNAALHILVVEFPSSFIYLHWKVC